MIAKICSRCTPVFHRYLGVPDDIISLWSLAEDPGA